MPWRCQFLWILENKPAVKTTRRIHDQPQSSGFDRPGKVLKMRVNLSLGDMQFL